MKQHTNNKNLKQLNVNNHWFRTASVSKKIFRLAWPTNFSPHQINLDQKVPIILVVRRYGKAISSSFHKLLDENKQVCSQTKLLDQKSMALSVAWKQQQAMDEVMRANYRMQMQRIEMQAKINQEMSKFSFIPVFSRII